MEAVGRAVMTRPYAYVPPIASLKTVRDIDKADFGVTTLAR
jgi:hypothetical protein